MRDFFGRYPPSASPWLKSSLRTAMRSGLLSGALAMLGLTAANAQEAAEQSNQPALQEVVVTGSRIPVPANITATSPLQVVTSQDIQLQGQTDITDVMNMLPQNTISSGTDFGNNSNPLTAEGGFATADLRGLGPQRTLVLVDGKRLGVGDPATGNTNPAPDLDQIPAALVERVDVVTGGASATYGSDAIAGVVNFIMKKDFQGVEVSGQYGFDQHNEHNSYIQNVIETSDANSGWTGAPAPTGSVRDGGKHDLSIILGTNMADGAGNVTGYFVYHNQASVPGSARDFSDCEAATNAAIADAPIANGYECLGSSNSNRFTPTTGPNANTRYTVSGTNLLLWPVVGTSPPAQFNFNNYEYNQREDERYQAGFMGHIDITDWAKPYVTVSFMDDRTQTLIAPSGLFSAGNATTADSNYLVNCSNPLLSTQEKGILCSPAQIAADTAVPGSASSDVDIGRRNIEGGGRTALYEHVNYRVVAGMQGNIGEAWSYDAYGQYYYVTSFTSNLNYLNLASVDNALQVTTKGGVPVCISGGACVPYNIFATGGVTPAQLNYLNSPGTSYGTNSEQIQHIDITGDLGKYGIMSPWAKDGIAVNFGAEHRFESVYFAPDAAELAGDLAGFGGASVPTNAGYEVSEGFAEVRAPLAHDLPGIYDLTVDAGYRYSNYSTSAGVTNTQKFEVQYAPIQSARMRVSFDRAVRAPNLIELFNAPAIGEEQVQTTDPCAPTLTGTTVVPATLSLADCEKTHVTPAQYGNGGTTSTIIQCTAGQCSEVTSGNLKLQPEVATTYSIGFTFTPTFVPNFSASIDYYHINLTGEIGTIPENVIFDQCVATGAPFYCNQIVRSAAGSLNGASVANGGYFLQQFLNTGVSVVSGYDLQMNYRMLLPADLGHLTAALSGTYLQHDTSTPYPGGPTYDCAGLFGSTCDEGSVNPRWRHNLRLNWETPWKVLFSVQWRFIGSSGFDNNSDQPLLHYTEEGQYDPLNARIGNYSYFDLSAIWNVYKGFELRAGVNNLLDKDPPFIPQYDVTGNSGPMNSYQTYDLLGRELFVAFKAKF